MRIVFFGSAEFACAVLDSLLLSPDDKLVGIVTQPDRPKGRSRKPAPCPIHAHMKKIKKDTIPILMPDDINSAKHVQAIRALSPDLIVIVAYGQILKSCILTIPGNGCINVHASLLPKYRGGAPIQWAIAHGEKKTGVTVIYVTETIDAGDIINQLIEPIRDTDTAGSLHDRLAVRGAELLMRAIAAIRQGTTHRTPQNNEEATYAPKLKKSDGKLNWNLSAIELNNRIRGFNPWPGCFFRMPDGRIIRVFKASVEKNDYPGEPGEILQAHGKCPLVQTGKEALSLLEVQPEGHLAMSGSAFLCGYRLQTGQKLK